MCLLSQLKNEETRVQAVSFPFNSQKKHKSKHRHIKFNIWFLVTDRSNEKDNYWDPQLLESYQIDESDNHISKNNQMIKRQRCEPF